MRSSRLAYCIWGPVRWSIRKLPDRQPRLLRQHSGRCSRAGSCQANCSVQKPAVKRAFVPACCPSPELSRPRASMRMGHCRSNAQEWQPASRIEGRVRARVPGTGLRAGASPPHTSFQDSRQRLRSPRKQKAGVPVSECAWVLAPRVASVPAAEQRTPVCSPELYQRPINSATGTIVRGANVTVWRMKQGNPKLRTRRRRIMAKGKELPASASVARRCVGMARFRK